MNTWNGNVYSKSYGVPDEGPSDFLNHGILGGIDNALGGILFGDPESSSNLLDEVLGVNAQKREFAQQEYLMDKQNEYNLPANQMARMKAAGINPNVAAGAISQGGNESAQAPSVPSASGAAASGVSALGSVIGGVASAALNNAQRHNLEAAANLSNANANRTDRLLQYEEDKFRADIAKTWIDSGMDKHMADYWSVKAAYADRQEWMDIQGKFWNIEKCQQEITNLEKDYDIKIEELKIKKEQVSQEEYRTAMMEVDKWFQDERKRIYAERGIDVNQSEDGMLVEAFANGQSDFILDGFEQKSARVSKGQFDAYRSQLSEQLQIEWTENLKGRAKELEQDEVLQKDLMKYGVEGDVTKLVVRNVVKYLFGTGFSVNVGRVGVSNSPAE